MFPALENKILIKGILHFYKIEHNFKRFFKLKDALLDQQFI